MLQVLGGLGHVMPLLHSQAPCKGIFQKSSSLRDCGLCSSMPSQNASAVMSSGVAAASHQGAFQATPKGFQASCSAAQFPWGDASRAGTSPASTPQAQEALGRALWRRIYHRPCSPAYSSRRSPILSLQSCSSSSVP